MIAVAARRAAVVSGLLVFAAACAGEGSDIGPRLPRIPDASSKVVLLDDQNRGVVAGTVSIVGTPMQAITGRNGRGDFLAVPSGRVLLRADGSAGAAASGDRLATIQVAVTMAGDVPMPIHLPDLPDSASSVVPTGLQGAPTALTSPNGSIVNIAAGITVSVPGAAGTTDIRIGDLAAQHLPGDLPRAGTPLLLFGAGVFVHPQDATFSPGIDIDIADDLNIGSGSAALYRLNPDTGEWGSVANVGVTVAGGRISVSGALTGGGLYAFGDVVTSTSLAGRVVDAEGLGVPGAMVRVDHLHTMTRGDGTFLLSEVPAAFGDGSPRTAQLECFAGGSWLPVIATLAVPIAGAAVDVGDVTLDTVLAGNVRVQQVVRARAEAFQPARLSSLAGDVALFTTCDANGQALFEDFPAGFFGFQEARRRNDIEVFYGQAVGFIDGGRRWLDSFQFLFNRGWFIDVGATRVYACDSVGGGPLLDAAIVETEEPNIGFLGLTRENGTLFGGRGFRGRLTASLRSERDGRSITHAFTLQRPDSDKNEMPLRRVLRQPLGAFERHGLVAGTLTGVTPSSEHGLRVTRRITAQEWWDEIVEGIPMQTSLPIDVDPATTHGTFQAGVAAAGGHLAAIEYTVTGSGNMLQSVGLLTEFQPVEGGVTARDVALQFAANETFSLVGAAASVDAAIDLNALELALGLELSNGHFVDVARDLAGSYAVAGGDLQFTLPMLPGSLGEGRWRALLRGATTAGGVTSTHASLLSLAEPTTTGVVLPAFPTLTSPAPAASVPASGFTVDYALPVGAFGGMIELRSEAASDLLLWQVLVPSGDPGFTFVTLPAEVETPLIAGRTYTLTVTAWFGDVDIRTRNPLADTVSFAQTVGLIEAGITQVSRRSIQITTL